MIVALESFEVTGTRDGLFPQVVYPNTEFRPEFRLDLETRSPGPVTTSEAKEENSHVVYQKYYLGSPTGEYYKVETSGECWWLLCGKTVNKYQYQPYLCRTKGPETAIFNADNSIKRVIFPLREDDAKIIGTNWHEHCDVF